MKSKNDLLTGGLDALLSAAPIATPQEQPAAPVAATAEEPGAKVRGNYKTVCYSIPPDIADKMRYIARYDRKKLNAVVVEAFAAYINGWEPATDEKPVKLTV